MVVHTRLIANISYRVLMYRQLLVQYIVVQNNARRRSQNIRVRIQTRRTTWSSKILL